VPDKNTVQPDYPGLPPNLWTEEMLTVDLLLSVLAPACTTLKKDLGALKQRFEDGHAVELLPGQKDRLSELCKGHGIADVSFLDIQPKTKNWASDSE